jgi:hypothetical protein
MSNDAYDAVLHQVQQLLPEEQLKLIEDLAVILRQRIPSKPKHSILELKGLGKEVWEGVDVDEYIRQERDSWGG